MKDEHDNLRKKTAGIKDFYDRAINECEKLGYSEEVE